MTLSCMVPPFPACSCRRSTICVTVLLADSVMLRVSTGQERNYEANQGSAGRKSYPPRSFSLPVLHCCLGMQLNIALIHIELSDLLSAKLTIAHQSISNIFSVFHCLFTRFGQCFGMSNLDDGR